MVNRKALGQILINPLQMLDTSQPLLSLKGITKRFPGVVALSEVNLDLGRGEVLALCGENGAGKSTLMNILGGIHQPDEGIIAMDGVSEQIHGVGDSMRLGVGFIHQELSVLDNLDVAGNMFLGREPRSTVPGLFDRKKMNSVAQDLLNRLGIPLKAETPVSRLSIAQRQLVEIARVLSLEARVIIMDEPTSSLTLKETRVLMNIISQLQGQGISILYISHRLAEVEECADRVVVLRDGKNAGGLAGDEIAHDRIVGLMVGREIKSRYQPFRNPSKSGFLQVRNARSSRYPFQTVDFDAAAGEILGFAGLVGSGRSELMKAIVGLDPDGLAEIKLDGKSIRIKTSRDAIRSGIYLVPEDRRGEGLITSMTVRENITLASLGKYSRFFWIQKTRESRAGARQLDSLKIKAPGLETVVSSLSGGNQQKVVIAKWLSMSPKVMILDEPTRGIDVGAKAEIYQLMRDLADSGAVILMISSDMEEIIHVSDSVAVMHEGQIAGVLEQSESNENNIMQLAAGGSLSRGNHS